MWALVSCQGGAEHVRCWCEGLVTDLLEMSMALFSQRKGLKPVQKAIQLGAMDNELRNRLWSALHEAVWSKWSAMTAYGSQTQNTEAVEHVVRSLWCNLYKLPVDALPAFDYGRPKSAYDIIRDHYFACSWDQAYDLIEFIVKSVPGQWERELVLRLNQYLTEENAGYRFVGDELTDITDEHEIDAIETALESGTKASRTHLSQALSMLSDRKNPDYRNSVKESISAVEAVCQAISGKQNGTLNDCLIVIKKQRTTMSEVLLHPAFDKAIDKLFAYTSGAGGIRHALTEEGSSVSQADAKFMLATCAAFVNYLWAKAAELGVKPASKV